MKSFYDAIKLDILCIVLLLLQKLVRVILIEYKML